MKKKSQVVKAITEQLEKENKFPDDDEFMPGDARTRTGTSQRLSMPFFTRKSPDEIAVDELLAGYDRSQGWYLKLEKEIVPNEWQFKRKIDDWRHWSDIQIEVVNIVRGETKEEVKRTGRCTRWGSGRYRIIVWNENGVRGERKPPVIIDVDAEEDVLLPNPTQQNSGTDAAEIIRIWQQANPTLDPTKAQEQMAAMFTKGLEISAQKEAKKEAQEQSMVTVMMNNQAQMTQLMIGLITAIIGKPVPVIPDSIETFKSAIGMVKDVAQLNAPPQNLSLVDVARQLKELGIIKPEVKSDDLVSQLSTIKNIASLVRDLAGAGPAERPSVLEKLVDILGPKIPDMISNVKDTVDKVAKLKQTQNAPAQPIALPQNQVIYVDEQGEMFTENGQPLAQSGTSVVSNQKKREEVNSENMFKKWADELWQYVSTGNYEAFDRITEVISTFFDGKEEMIRKAKEHSITPDKLIKYILMFDKTHYTSQDALIALHDYADKYLTSFNEGIIGICQICGAEFKFDNEQAFQDEKGENEGRVLCNINGCQGEIALEQVRV